MSTYESTQPGCWTAGKLPDNVRLGVNSVINGELAFKRFYSQQEIGLSVGANSTMDGVQFAIGAQGHVEIGNYCYFTSVVLLCELEVRIGNYVAIGWNATIADTDFHPIDPAERIADAIACSPLGKGRSRPFIAKVPVIIENDVWIGPNATILKGVRIGAGAFVEPGALITHNVPAGARVIGNPAKVVGRI